MKALLLSVLFLGALGVHAKSSKGVKAWLDKASAAAEYKGFEVQGEYELAGKGLQIAAMPKGQFHVVVWNGGLPGAGWDGKAPTSELVSLAAATSAAAKGKRIERVSPTMGAKAPEGADIIFAGKESDLIKGKVKDGLLWAGAQTKKHYGSFKLHLEFRQPFKPDRMLTNQDRGNSGVYIFNRYEVQVLDSFTAPHAFAESLAFRKQSDEKQWCASLYKKAYPKVNMCRPALEWQTYDIDFTAPTFVDGKKTANARITVRHNGVVVHENLELSNGTGAGGRRPEVPKEAIYLQDHGNPVAYRNIWIVPVDK